MMSRISGVKRGRTTSSSSSINKLDGQPPTYGVEDVSDSILSQVWTVIFMLPEPEADCMLAIGADFQK